MALSNGDQIAYGYDGAYRLTSETRTRGGQTLFQQSFAYDAVGNRTSTSRDGRSALYTYNSANQLLTETWAAHGAEPVEEKTYAYDADGNTTSIATYQGTGQNRAQTLQETMTYDALSRQTHYTRTLYANNHPLLPATETTTYRGAQWHRWSVAATGFGSGNHTTRFLYDFNNAVLDVVKDGEQWRADKFYLSPNVDENVMLLDIAAGNRYYYSHDALNTVRTLSDENASVVANYDYDAFGAHFSPNTTSTYEQRYRYTNRELQSDARSMYYRYRNYAPSSGRFIQRDPIYYNGSSEANLYGYVSSMPLENVDPFGLKAINLASDTAMLNCLQGFLNSNDSPFPPGMIVTPHQDGVSLNFTWYGDDGRINNLKFRGEESRLVRWFPGDMLAQERYYGMAVDGIGWGERRDPCQRAETVAHELYHQLNHIHGGRPTNNRFKGFVRQAKYMSKYYTRAAGKFIFSRKQPNMPAAYEDAYFSLPYEAGGPNGAYPQVTDKPFWRNPKPAFYGASKSFPPPEIKLPLPRIHR